MPSGNVSVAAATAVVGYDLFVDAWFQQVGYDRALTGIATQGSAAAGDTAFELFIDTAFVGDFRNTDTGFPNMDDMIPLEGNYVPAGAKLRAIVTDAATTNPINIILNWAQ